MKALVYHGRKDVRYQDYPEPDRLEPNEVRLKVKCAGLCHTDYNEYAHGPIYVSQTPHARTGRSIPLVLGHEFSGEVVEVGNSVQHVEVGDRVAVNGVDSCRNCSYCRRGQYALCPSASYIGFGRDGGFADFAVVPEKCCYRIGPSISHRAGVLVEPLAVAMHAVKQARLEIGSRVAIVGGGGVGLCTLQALRATGVRDVFMIEKSEAKKGFSMGLGAAAFVNPERTDPQLALRELTEGLGVDVAFECVGTEAALSTAVTVTRGGGTICVVGVFPGPFQFDFNALMSKEQAIVTSLSYGNEFPIVIAMLSDGRLKAEPLVTLTLPLADAVDKGLRQYETLVPTNLRIVIDINP